MFTSNRSGTTEIWTCDKNGGNLKKLTAADGYYRGTPRWSPDGRWIAFDARRAADRNIFVISANGGAARRVTNSTSADILPSWSHDGRWIYFSSNRGGSRNVWKIPAEGGEPVQLARDGGFEAFESADRQYIYYSRNIQPWEIRRLRLDDGKDERVDELTVMGTMRCWALSGKGIHFVSESPGAKSGISGRLIRFADFETHEVSDVALVPGPLVANQGCMAVSLDGRTLLYAQRDRDERDIMLVENFK